MLSPLENILENQFHFRDYEITDTKNHSTGVFNFVIDTSRPLENQAGEAIGQWVKSGCGSINFIIKGMV